LTRDYITSMLLRIWKSARRRSVGSCHQERILFRFQFSYIYIFSIQNQVGKIKTITLGASANALYALIVCV